jgi:hypothetical protein
VGRGGFRLIYVLTLSLFPALVVAMREGARFRELTADKENVSRTETEGSGDMEQMKTGWESYGTTFPCSKSNVI